MMVWSKSIDGMSPVTVTVPTQRDLLRDLKQRLQSQSGFSIATLNLDHVVKLERDPDFLAAYAEHSHVTADGNPIVWLERLSGHNGIELVTGSDLILPLADVAAEVGAKVAFFGSTDASLKAAKSYMTKELQGLDVVLTLSPPMGFDPIGPDADAAIDAIRKSGARLVFLALGAPRQERFAAYAQRALPDTGFVSIGAGLDFMSGRQRRAPVWMQKANLEWIWRLIGDPGRMVGRYAACAALLPGLFLRAVKRRSAR